MITLMRRVVLVILGCTTIAAAALADGPMGILRSSHTRINDLLVKELSEQDKAKTRDEIKRVVNSFLDYRELARRSLNHHWDARTRKEQDEFVTILRELIERNYVKQLRDNLDYKVLYNGEKINGEEAVVHTAVRIRKRGRDIDTPIDYQLRKGPNGWVVYDIITDEISLVRTYRSQFNRIIQRESFDALVKRMRKKLNES